MLKSIVICTSIALAGGLTGCNALQNHDKTPIVLKENTRYASELSERLGKKVQMSENEAKKLLMKLSIDSNKRYQSLAPVDKLSLSLKDIHYTENGHSYKMRDVNLVISRGDSRIIKTTDVQIKFSGVSEAIRVTYSINGLIWLNGQEVGFYDPSNPNYWDARINSTKNPGVIYLRAVY